MSLFVSRSILRGIFRFYIIATCFLILIMSRMHVKAKSRKSAINKATSKTRVVSKCNYIAGSKDGHLKTYDVITRKRKK
jgi:hypothetical protein